MGIHFEIDTNVGVIFATCEGEVGVSDFQDLRTKYSTHPNYRSKFDLLIDGRGATFNLTGKDAQTLAKLRVEKPLAKRMVVVGDNSFGFIRMFHGWTGNDPSTMVFKDMKSAREWLGLALEDE